MTMIMMREDLRTCHRGGSQLRVALRIHGAYPKPT